MIIELFFSSVVAIFFKLFSVVPILSIRINTPNSKKELRIVPNLTALLRFKLLIIFKLREKFDVILRIY